MQRKLYFPAIDGLRFFAFFLVFLHHCKPVYPNRLFYDTGWIGVELFFLISAFLLTKLLKEEYSQSKAIHIRHFYARRILRIWPLYFFYLAIVTVYAITIATRPFDESRLIGNIFFYDNFLSALHSYNKNIFTFHLWSVSLEEQYYLLFPFAVPWLVKQNQKTVIRIFLVIYAAMIAGRIVSVIYEKHHPFIYVLPLSGDCILAGILLGLGFFDKLIAKLSSWLAFIAALLLLSTILILPARSATGYHQVYLYTIIALAFSLLFISASNNPNKVISFIFTNKLVRYLGKISYGLYVYHIVSIYGARSICYRLQLDPVKYHFLLSLFITIIISILSYELFEKLVLRYKKRYTVITNREP
jgi:peptidoglycan/LPS O-acetylase OafA/YrhL